tara:strand:+ start:6442 stop:7224 length:783 start_codon:yes stop_codon:yes gene_type:complete
MTSYDEINNTKATYSKISLNDIRTHYTLWSEEGQRQWYVYKCKTKSPLDKFGKSFGYSSWIMMSPALDTQEGLLNNNRWPGFSHRTIQAINGKITEMKNKLKKEQEKWDNNPTPLWYEASEDSMDEKVKEVRLQVSIGSIINKVKDILLATQGDILSMTKVVRNLQLDSTFNFAKTTDHKKKVKSASDVDGVEVFVLFDCSHTISDSQYKIKRVCGFSKKKIHIKGHYYIFKPKNKAAIKVCENLQNSKIRELLQSARRI